MVRSGPGTGPNNSQAAVPRRAALHNGGMPREFGRFLTLADTADLLNVSVDDVFALVDSGELPAIQLGSGLWRVERNVLEMFIDGKYEEQRRVALFRENLRDDVPEISGGEESLRRSSN